MSEDVKCIICNSGCQSQSVGVPFGGGSKLLSNLIQLKLAFSLLCKLISSVSVTVDGRTIEHEEHNELLKQFQEFSTVSLNGNHAKGITSSPSLSACDLCSKTLLEILRVEREIEDLKNSQWVHVNALKRSLLLLTENTEDINDGGDEDDYWKVIRRQLIAWLQVEGVATPAESSQGRRSGRSAKRVIVSSTTKGKHNAPVISSLPQPIVDSPVLKPCSVKLTRLNLNAIVKTVSVGGNQKNIHTLNSLQPKVPAAPPNGRPIRKSKQKACELLRKTLVKSASYPDDEEEEQIQCAPSDEEWNADGDFSDDNLEHSKDFGENLSYEHRDFLIKQENDIEDDAADDQMLWMDWSTTKVNGVDVKIEHDAKRDPPTRTTKELTNRVGFLADNLYMYNCTVFQFSPDERQFLCQEPDCGAVIPGTMLDGSLFRNIKSHVDEHHHLVFKADGKTRYCPICPFETEETPKKFRLHITNSHITYGQKRIHVVLCEICGRQGFASVIHKHRWSHKNFQEQVDAIQAGETYPLKLKNKLRPHDPLHPFVFGEKQKQEPRIELPGLETKQLPKTFCVYALQWNVYMYRFTTFKYSVKERVFTCQEPGCSTSFPEYDNLPVVQMKGHVHKRHFYSWRERNKHFVRKCLLCSETIQGLASFHIHMMREHGSNQKGVEPTAICEICMKPGLEPENYLQHVWTHKNEKEAVAAAKKSKTELPCDAYNDQNDRVDEDKLTGKPPLSQLQEHVKQSSQVKTAKEAESQKEEATPLNFLQENMYMYDCTIIKYCTQERHFICQEPECGALIPGTLLDCSNLVSSIKTHVEQHHSSTELNVCDITRSCPFCSYTCVEPPNLFRKHIESEHVKLKRLTSVVCEICGNSSVNIHVLRDHVWSHRDFQDKVKALQAGEEYPDRLKLRLSRQRDDPLYSIIFPDGSGTLERNKTKKKRTISNEIKLPHRHKVSSKINFVYCLPQNLYMYRYTIFKYSAEERHFVCQEADCSEKFPEWMDSLISVMKNHVYKTHIYRWSIIEGHSRTCPLCFNECERLQRFHQHMLQEHHSKQSEALILCEICMKPLCASDNYMRHVNTHNPPEDPSKIVLSSTNKVRARDAVEDELLPCKVCGKKYTKTSLKYHHLPRHEAYEKRRKYECPQCNKLFVTAHGLRNHTERIHRASDQSLWIKCSVPGCDRKFYKRATFQINEHLQQHKGEAHWICELCGKTFSARNSLKDHHRSVHEPRKFQCEECGKKFTCSSHLSRHKKQQHNYK